MDQIEPLFRIGSDSTAESAASSTLGTGMLYVGDALEVLQQLPAESAQAVVTSPPYWGLRDYGVKRQIGAEPTIEEYVSDLVSIFSEMKRVLREDGVFWLNLGDSYTSGGRKWRQADKKLNARGMSYRPDTPAGMKPKDLIGVPWMVAFALRNDGWYLRTDVIWNKPNANPESVKDRPTRSHEYVFMLTRNEKYYYDVDATKEPTDDGKRLRRKRSVWNVNTEPFAGAHFATFPTKLVEPCIRASSKQGDTILDPFFGSGTVGQVARKLGRNFVGIELSLEYASIARERLSRHCAYDLPIVSQQQKTR